jgi:hypothetical protein
MGLQTPFANEKRWPTLKGLVRLEVLVRERHCRALRYQDLDTEEFSHALRLMQQLKLTPLRQIGLSI